MVEGAEVEGAVEGEVAVVEGAVGAEVVVHLPIARAAQKAAVVREGRRRRCSLSGIAPTSESKQFSTRSS